MLVATHVMPVTGRPNCAIMSHFPHKSTSVAKESVPIRSETTTRGLREVVQLFSRALFKRIITFYQVVMRISCASTPSAGLWRSAATIIVVWAFVTRWAHGESCNGNQKECSS